MNDTPSQITKENSFRVYILWSAVLQKWYTGYSGNVTQRLKYHNLGISTFTKRGTPWHLKWTSSGMSKKEAIQLERKIKKRGAKRFLGDISKNQ